MEFDILFNLFDLTEGQKKILKTLFYRGNVNTTDITKETGISRPNCYDILNKLIEKGLVTRFFQNKKTFYRANKIDYSGLLNMKIEEIKNTKEAIDKYNSNVDFLEKNSENYEIESYYGERPLLNLFLILSLQKRFVFLEQKDSLRRSTLLFLQSG